uniref:Uncharacterized protein n=1 Tax=Romanomermis culicivorax TaxID=13658 RepID=A0A915JWR8_ROMCU
MTNASEGFNKVLKTWTSWREMPIDVAVLAFYTHFVITTSIMTAPNMELGISSSTPTFQ